MKDSLDRDHMQQKWTIVIAAGLGMMTFLIIYGAVPLNPANDAWIMSGYDEHDIIQHYSGWLAFRASKWRFPLGLADRMAIGDGTIISYTDSIPWLAVLFKLLSGMLPETFQYFGIYVLLCYILQGIASYYIIYYKTQDVIYSLVGEVFFVFSPIMMERAFRHTALASHWLILFSVLFFFRHRDNYRKINYCGLLLLEVLAVGIHPYFLPMIFCFSFLCVVKDIERRRYSSVIGLGIQLLVIYITGIVLGVLGSGINVSRSRYGFFSMNLNALINPTSAGRYTWSSFLNVRPQILGNYDGFNYLGIGMMLLIFVCFFFMVRMGGKKRSVLLNSIRSNGVLIIAMLFLTVFAVTNVVTWNDKIIYEYELPDKVLYLCGIFRASGRLFYPVYYIMYFFGILQLWQYKDKLNLRIIYTVLFLTLCLQIFDLKNVIIEKNIDMYEKKDYYSLLCDDKLKKIADQSEYVSTDWCENMTHSIAVWAFKNGLGTYFSTANSGQYPEASRLAMEIKYGACDEGNIGKTVIVTTDVGTAIRYMQILGINGYYTDGVYFFYSDEGVKDRIYTLGEIELDLSVYNTALSNQTNDVLDSGVWVDGEKMLCFNYSPDMLNVLQNSQYVVCEGKWFQISSISSWDEWSIYVEVDEAAGICRYPAILQLY